MEDDKTNPTTKVSEEENETLNENSNELDPAHEEKNLADSRNELVPSVNGILQSIDLFELHKNMCKYFVSRKAYPVKSIENFLLNSVSQIQNAADRFPSLVRELVLRLMENLAEESILQVANMGKSHKIMIKPLVSEPEKSLDVNLLNEVLPLTAIPISWQEVAEQSIVDLYDDISSVYFPQHLYQLSKMVNFLRESSMELKKMMSNFEKADRMLISRRIMRALIELKLVEISRGQGINAKPKAVLAQVDLDQLELLKWPYYNDIEDEEQ